MALDLDIDLGELDDEPEDFYRLCTVANLACGGHAGDEASLRRACARAAQSGASVVAHPSYLDRAGFGRRTPEWIEAGAVGPFAEQLEEQLNALLLAARSVGISVVGLKAHGALYHDLERVEGLAALVVNVGRRVLGPVSFVGPAGGRLQAECLSLGLGFVREGFADRGTDEAGRLMARGQPGALLEPAAAAAQARQLAASGDFDSLCVHGDGPRALEVARAVRFALEDGGFLGRGP